MSEDSANGEGSPAALAELRKRWALLPAKKRLEGLLDQKDARRAVQETPVAQLYYAIEEVGLADATDVVQLASPEQFRGFIDLGGWNRDRVEPSDVLRWIRALRGDEPEDFLATLHGMDLEVLELLIRHYVEIHDLEENPDANPTDLTYETPEGKYLLEIHAEPVEAQAVRQLLHDLIGENPFESVRLLEAIRWEIPSELEETAYRFRSGRLSDLGFPTLEQAASLFARVEIPAPATREAGAALSVERSTSDLVSVALAGLTEDERANAEDELRGVANAVLVAEISDPGDLAAVRGASEMARDYLSLGFDQLTGGDPGRAVSVLRETPLRRIFQVGFSMTLGLKFRADRLMAAPASRAGELALVLDEEASVLSALRRKRPLRALKVPGAEPVPFRSRRELSETEAAIGRAEAQVPVLRAAFGGADPAIAEAVLRCADPVVPTTAQRLFAAALAWSLLEPGVGPQVRPVPMARLAEVAVKASDEPAAKAACVAALEKIIPASLRDVLPPMVERVLRAIAADLKAPVAPGGTQVPFQPDPS